MQAVTNHDTSFSFVSHAATKDNGMGSQSLCAVQHERNLARKTSIFDQKQQERYISSDATWKFRSI